MRITYTGRGESLSSQALAAFGLAFLRKLPREGTRKVHTRATRRSPDVSEMPPSSGCPWSNPWRRTSRERLADRLSRPPRHTAFFTGDAATLAVEGRYRLNDCADAHLLRLNRDRAALVLLAVRLRRVVAPAWDERFAAVWQARGLTAPDPTRNGSALAHSAC